MKIWPNVYLNDFLLPADWLSQTSLPPAISDGSIPADQDVSEGNSQTGTLTQTRPKTKQPSLYKVILLNDDFTPMDFVVHILRKFFRKNEAEANSIMLQVHHQGAGIAGIFSHEVAETKVYLVNEYSRQNQHPLKCILEKS